MVLFIAFQQGSGLNFEVFADEDYNCKTTDRRSVSSGVVVMCGEGQQYVGFLGQFSPRKPST